MTFAILSAMKRIENEKSRIILYWIARANFLMYFIWAWRTVIQINPTLPPSHFLQKRISPTLSWGRLPNWNRIPVPSSVALIQKYCNVATLANQSHSLGCFWVTGFSRTDRLGQQQKSWLQLAESAVRRIRPRRLSSYGCKANITLDGWQLQYKFVTILWQVMAFLLSLAFCPLL